MVSDVYKNEISALQESIDSLTKDLEAEQEKVKHLTAQAAGVDDAGVVVSITKTGAADLQHDLESVTTQLIEAKMALAQETHERHDIETQLQQNEKARSELEENVAELRLKVGSLSTQ